MTNLQIVGPNGYTLNDREKPFRIEDLTPVWDLDAEIDWLVNDLIPRRAVTLICAESGMGKTWLAEAISGAVARGKAFAEFGVTQVAVLYLDGENPLQVVLRNITELGIPRTETFHIWGGWSPSPPPGPDDARIISFARETKGLLIFDSFVQFNPGDEQSSTETRKFMNGFRHLADLGATVIVLHHTGKSESSKIYRGSTDIKASVDMAYVMKGQPRNGKIHRLTLENFKSRIAPGQNSSALSESDPGLLGKIDPGAR